jgi:CubicO group peptidase (beta-lactamase class C family)
VTVVTAAAIAELLEAAVRSGVAPGAAAAWGRAADSPRLLAVGRAGFGSDFDAAHHRTWWDLASLTKPLVVTTLCLRAFRRGRVALETTVGEVFDEAAGRPLAGVSFRQLLTHSSGLPGWRPLYAMAKRPAAAVDTILGLDLEAPPGRRVEYSCPGFVLLGEALEIVHGEPLDRSFDRQVLQSLGLQAELGFLPDPATRQLAGGARLPTVERRLTAEQGFDPATVPRHGPSLPDDGNCRFLGGVAGNAGLFGSAVGVFCLGREFLLGAGSLLEEAEIAAATVSMTSGLEQHRGLGWQMATSPGCSAGPGLGSRAFGHTGFTGTSVWIDPEVEAVLVLLTNRHHPGHREQDLHPLRRRFHELAMRDLENRV